MRLNPNVIAIAIGWVGAVGLLALPPTLLASIPVVARSSAIEIGIPLAPVALFVVILATIGWLRLGRP